VSQVAKKTPRIAHSRNKFVHLFTHGVLYIEGLLVNLNHKSIPGHSRTFKFNYLSITKLIFHNFPGPRNFRKNPGLPGGVGTRLKL